MQEAELTTGHSGPDTEELPSSYTPRHSKRSAALTLAAVSLIFVVSVLYSPSPVRADGGYFTICLFKNLSGLPCPGCGLTHSFCELGKGHILEAFRFNLLGPVAFFLAFLVWARSLFVLAGWAKPVLAMDRAASRVKLIPTLVLALVIFGLARIIYLLAI